MRPVDYQEFGDTCPPRFGDRPANRPGKADDQIRPESLWYYRLHRILVSDERIGMDAVIKLKGDLRFCCRLGRGSSA